MDLGFLMFCLGVTFVFFVFNVYRLYRNLRVYNFSIFLNDIAHTYVKQNCLFGEPDLIDKIWEKAVIDYDKMFMSFKPLKLKNWLTKEDIEMFMSCPVTKKFIETNKKYI